MAKSIDQDTLIKLLSGDLINDVYYKRYYLSSSSGGTIIRIEDVILTEISLFDIHAPYRIFFHNIDIVNGFKILSGDFREGIMFSDCRSIGSISYFYLTDGEFGYINFRNCIFNGSFSISGGNFKYLDFSNTKFDYNLYFDGGSFDKITLDKQTRTDNLVWFRGGFYKNIVLNGCDLSKLFIEEGTFIKITFDSESKIDECIIKGGIHETIIFNSTELKKIKIILLTEKTEYQENILLIDDIIIKNIGKASFEVKSADINLIHFDSTLISKDANIILVDVMAKSLKFTSTYVYGQLNFNNFNINKGQFIISNSDLGKTVFVNCDLSHCTFGFTSSKITEVFISGTVMPTRISGTPIQQRLGYGQIRKIFENRGDNIEAGDYFSKQMNAYYESLSWKNNKSELINLYLNKISTDHGSNWLKGFLTTLCVGLIFYIPYCFLIGYRLRSPFIWNNVLNFFSLASYFGEYINPVHKADFLINGLQPDQSKSIPISIARMVEVVSRIFIGYFIYQLIQAFRKHGRK